jgi:TRAP-type mannitol/chloroaromatic compound transport system permease small subunit
MAGDNPPELRSRRARARIALVAAVLFLLGVAAYLYGSFLAMALVFEGGLWSSQAAGPCCHPHRWAISGFCLATVSLAALLTLGCMALFRLVRRGSQK